MSRIALALALLVALFAIASAAQAQEDKSYIDYRQKLMRGIGADMGAISDILKFNLPLQGNLEGHALAIQTHAGLIAAAFEKKAMDGAHDSLPAVWEEPENFAAAAKVLGDEAGKFAEAARSGDAAAIGQRVRDLGGACGACHDEFRVEKEQSYKNR